MPLSTLIKKLFFRSVGILDLISRTSCPSPPLHAEHCNYAVSTKRMVKTICIPKKYHNPNAHFNMIIKIQSRAQKSKSAFRAIQSNRENSKITNVHHYTEFSENDNEKTEVVRIDESRNEKTGTRHNPQTVFL